MVAAACCLAVPAGLRSGQAAGGSAPTRTSALLLARIAPGCCWRKDAAVRRGERAEDAGRRGPRDRASPADFGQHQRYGLAHPRRARASRASASR